MLARTFSGAVSGIDARLVEIEVNLSAGGRMPPGNGASVPAFRMRRSSHRAISQRSMPSISSV